jgi:pilus assembly protein FimV
MPEAPTSFPDVSLSMDEIKLDDDDLQALPSFNATAPMPVTGIEPPPAAHDAGMLEFDIGSLSLDLEPAAEKPTEAPDSIGEDPLETKLALAEEFVSIGDEDGARALIEEVVAEATGDMRAKAQRALANLS